MYSKSKPWHLYNAQDDVAIYSEPFDLEAVLSAPKPTGSVEESASVQTPPPSEGLTPRWSSSEQSSTSAQTPPAAEVKGHQDLLELRRLRAELQDQLVKNSVLEKSLKYQEKVSKETATRLDQANVLLQKKEDYIYKSLLKIKDLDKKLENEVQKNRRLEERLQKQTKMNKDKSVQLEEAHVLLQAKEDYIFKSIMANKELGEKLHTEAKKCQKLEETAKTQLKLTQEKSVRLDQAHIQLQKKEEYIEKMVWRTKKLGDKLQDQVNHSRRHELRMKEQDKSLEDMTSKLKEAEMLLNKKESYIEKLLLIQSSLQKQLKGESNSQRPRGRHQRW